MNTLANSPFYGWEKERLQEVEEINERETPLTQRTTVVEKQKKGDGGFERTCPEDTMFLYIWEFKAGWIFFVWHGMEMMKESYKNLFLVCIALLAMSVFHSS